MLNKENIYKSSFSAINGNMIILSPIRYCDPILPIILLLILAKCTSSKQSCPPSVQLSFVPFKTVNLPPVFEV